MTSPSSAASGMSKREHFAGLALMGIVGRQLAGEVRDNATDKIQSYREFAGDIWADHFTFAAEVSVRYADALIERLDIEADFDDLTRTPDAE